MVVIVYLRVPALEGTGSFSPLSSPVQAPYANDRETQDGKAVPPAATDARAKEPSIYTHA